MNLQLIDIIDGKVAKPIIPDLEEYIKGVEAESMSRIKSLETRNQNKEEYIEMYRSTLEQLS